MVLICLGIVMIYSASSIYAWEQYKDTMFYLKRHLSFLAIGAVLTFIVMSVDYRKFRKIAKPLLVIALVLLVLVLIPGLGREVSGARRWFRFKFLSFQPSELANLALIIYVADYISRKGDTIRQFFRGFLPPACILGLCCLYSKS